MIRIAVELRIELAPYVHEAPVPAMGFGGTGMAGVEGVAWKHVRVGGRHEY